jgi:phosphohistidine phosphatase
MPGGTAEMRRLLLMRHAKTEKDAPSGKDRDRRLDTRGEAEAVQMGEWLAAQRLLPDRALVSTATRARQTWDRVSGGWPAVAAEFRDDLYMAETGDLLGIIRAAAGEDPRALMVLAHNPSLQEIALAMVGGGPARPREALLDNLPTAGVVVIDFPVDDWGDVAFRGGQLDRFVTPRQLRDAG